VGWRVSACDRVAAGLPDVRTLGIAAGLHLIAEFPARYGPTSSILERAAAAGVRLRPISEYATGSAVAPSDREQSAAMKAPAQIVFGYAHLTPRRITSGIEALTKALRA